MSPKQGGQGGPVKFTGTYITGPSITSVNRMNVPPEGKGKMSYFKATVDVTMFTYDAYMIFT